MTSIEYLEQKRALLRDSIEREIKKIRDNEGQPDRVAAIVELAEEAMQNRYALPGTGEELFDVGNPPKWKELPIANEEFLWALARFPGVDPLTKAYIVTGERKYADKALSDTVNFIETCPPFALENLDDAKYIDDCFSAGTTNPWRQLETGLRMAFTMRDLYRRLLLSECMTPEIHDKLAKSFHDHAAQLSVVSPILWPDSNHNHYLSEMTGLLSAVSLFPEFEESKAWLRQATEGLEKCATNQIMADGAQLEGSPHYHNICVETFMIVMEIAKEGGIELSDTFKSLIDRSLEYSAWAFAPNGVLSSIGDSGYNADIEASFFARLDAMGESYGELYRVANIVAPPEGFDTADYRNTQHNSYTMIGSPVIVDKNRFADAKARAHSCEGGVKHYKSVGHIFGRTGWEQTDSWFSMICHTPVFNGHAHIDPLSVELVLNGKPVIVDPSYATYEECANRKLFKSAKYHSCLTFNDRDPFEYINRWVFGEQKYGSTENVYEIDGFIGGDGTHQNYAPNEHKRLVLLDNDTFIIVDKVKNVTGEDVKLNFHMYDDSFSEAEYGFYNKNVRVILPKGLTYTKESARRAIVTEVFKPSTRLIATDSTHEIDKVYVSVFTTNDTVSEAGVIVDDKGIKISYNKDGKQRSFIW